MEASEEAEAASWSSRSAPLGRRARGCFFGKNSRGPRASMSAPRARRRFVMGRSARLAARCNAVQPAVVASSWAPLLRSSSTTDSSPWFVACMRGAIWSTHLASTSAPRCSISLTNSSSPVRIADMSGVSPDFVGALMLDESTQASGAHLTRGEIACRVSSGRERSDISRCFDFGGTSGAVLSVR